MTQKTIKLDCNDIKSIRDAERQKMRLENQGYRQIRTRQIGLDKWEMVYEQ